VILQRLRQLWGGAELKLMAKDTEPIASEQSASQP
jgi:hypothetical protein